MPKGAKVKSPSDLRRICAEGYESVAEAVGRRSDAGKLYERAAKTCCREIERGAKTLSKRQQTYLWYQYASENDLEGSRRQLEEIRALEDELEASLPRPEILEVSAVRMLAGLCLRRLER